jgi:5,10-methenyltetrahydromethanopterin hydrogenase
MKKGLMFVAAGVIALGVITTGAGYANSINEVQKPIVDVTSQSIDANENVVDRMINIMKQNGFGNMAEVMEERDYKAMDDFMNNMTDEDYNNMIEIMKGNGYEGMAKMMESIDKDAMIQMHNSMGGAQNMMNGGMMGRY